MKLTGRDALRYLARPDPDRPGMLLSGADGARVAMRRAEVAAALAGPEAEAEMRLVRMQASEVRQDGAALADALRARGFFPGPRVVVLEDATDGMADTIAAALADWQPGDAALVVTAGDLKARSPLRKLFEGHSSAVSIVFYDDPPGREEILAEMARAGLPPPPSAAMTALEALAADVDPVSLRQIIGMVALYKLGDPDPLTPEEVTNCAPVAQPAALDDLLDRVADGDVAAVGPIMRRLAAQGMAPVTVAIMAARRFRLLHAASADPAGPETAFSRARPPVFGPRRDRMARQVRNWGTARLEAGMRLLTEADLALRSSSRAPAGAVLERALIRLATLAGRGQGTGRGAGQAGASGRR